MENQPNSPTDAPEPEALKPQVDVEVAKVDTTSTPGKPSKRGSYKPGHKATFIGLLVVGAILAINGVIIWFVLKGQNDTAEKIAQESVVLSPATLNSLGLNKTPVGNLGAELVVGPNSKFKGDVTVSKNINIGGQLNLNSKLTAGDASLAKLSAGDTSVNAITINGDASATNLTLRKDLTVVGTTRLQGPVTMSQLLTVNNNVNIGGSLAVGGTLTVRSFQASSLTSDTTLTIGGHIIARGTAPSVTAGPGVGPTGTVSISGSDAAGTVAVNTGLGAPGGIVATVTFHQAYAQIPHVVLGAVGGGIGNVYVNRSSTGFSIGINGAIPPGGYAVDYVVVQ